MRKLCMINRISYSLGCPTLCMVISSLVFTRPFFCSLLWSGTSKRNISKLQLVQIFATYSRHPLRKGHKYDTQMNEQFSAPLPNTYVNEIRNTNTGHVLEIIFKLHNQKLPLHKIYLQTMQTVKRTAHKN